MLTQRAEIKDGETYEKLPRMFIVRHVQNFQVIHRYRDNRPSGARQRTRNIRVKPSNHKSRKFMLMCPIKYREY